jgi:transcriptional regulator with XRE-family HTH domain
MIGLNEVIAKIIDKFLISNNKNQNDLANFINIDIEEINEYMNYKKPIPLKKMVKIAAFFDISVDDFLIKAKVSKKDYEQVEPSETINFKECFMGQYSSKKVVGQF